MKWIDVCTNRRVPSRSGDAGWLNEGGRLTRALTSSRPAAEVTHKPSPCYIKSQKGDKLSMHYDG
jgi:hypothetical protein